jgi:CheY-like chemotaxis protein
MSQQPTVLIVEDDPVFRRVMNFTIARCGFSVETASDGQAAYQRLCQGGVDFLVTDHQMPVCSGLELLEMLESNTDVTRPPTVLCTAKGLELDSQGLQARFGLAAVMHKPFSPRKLSELILQIIEADKTPTPPASIALALDNSAATVPAVRGPVDG